jgi:CheY-like chemotaxis protein
MDIRMPILDGHGATKKLRDAGFAKPIIAFTAHSIRDERDRSFQAGCTDFITKPLEREHLIEVLARYADR